ncbi:MAG: putative metal-binding motif-containing protein [Nanoarchaeota archaeon]
MIKKSWFQFLIIYIILNFASVVYATCNDSDSSLSSHDGPFIAGDTTGVFLRGWGTLYNGTGHIIGNASDRSRYYYSYNPSLNYSIFYDYCDPNNPNREWEGKCSKLYNGTQLIAEFIWIVYNDCPLGCENGACRKPDVVCIDYDKSSDITQYYNASYATGVDQLWRTGYIILANGTNVYDPTLPYSLYYDRCVSGTNQLNEARCVNGKLEFYGFQCVNGCENSSCKIAQCIDSDNGKSYDAKGNTSGQTSFFNALNNYTDTCLNISSLREYYCENKFVKNEIYSCNYGCTNGKCNFAPECTDKDSDEYSIDGGFCGIEDCDDLDSKINPNATEICDEKDNNCNELIDEDTTCELDITLNSPQGGVFNSKKIIFDLVMNQEVEELSYIDYSDERQRQQSLCRKCKEYGNTQIQIKNLKEGVHNITFIASKYGYYEEQTVSIFIDSIEPKIKKTIPKKKEYGNGSFIISYEEDNPKQITLYYGNLVNGKDDCSFNADEKTKSCTFDVDLSEFDNKSLVYSFEIEDMAGNKEQSKETEIYVDLTKPGINKLNYSIESRKVNFDIEVNEKVDLEYYDENERRPKWKSLCRRCNTYDRKKLFGLGEHNIIIRVTDKAGNTEEKDATFFIS